MRNRFPEIKRYCKLEFDGIGTIISKTWQRVDSKYIHEGNIDSKLTKKIGWKIIMETLIKHQNMIFTNNS